MCPLQIINDIEPLSSTLHSVNACFIHHPSNVENYSISHKSETGLPKKRTSGEYIFTPLYWFWAHNSKYKWPKIFVEHLGNRHLTAQQMAHW